MHRRYPGLLAGLVMIIPSVAGVSRIAPARSASLPYRSASHPQAAVDAVFRFGYRGGNMLPSSVTLFGNGKVKATGPLSRSVKANQRLSRYEINALVKLAGAERFTALPALIKGQPIPDVGSRYISMTASSGATTVVEQPTTRHTAANDRFEELFFILQRVVTGSCGASGDIC
jgi:hypothetical protein